MRAAAVPPGTVPVVEIGGTHVSAFVVDVDNRRVLRGRGESTRVLSGTGDGNLVQAVLACAASLRTHRNAHWGVALPGPFDYSTGRALWAGVGKFDTLHGLDLRRVLLEGLPDQVASVLFLNDAHAFVIGEWAAGVAVGRSRVVGLTLGTGIGSAFLDRGVIVDHGPGLPPEGRADLLVISGRPLEDTISRRAILARYRAGTARASDDKNVDVEEICRRARHGEASAGAVLTAAFTALGRAVSPSVNAFATDVVVVGGSMSRSWDVLGPPLTRAMKSAFPEDEPFPAVVMARDAEHAAAIGVATRVAAGLLESLRPPGADPLPASGATGALMM